MACVPKTNGFELADGLLSDVGTPLAGFDCDLSVLAGDMKSPKMNVWLNPAGGVAFALAALALALAVEALAAAAAAAPALVEAAAGEPAKKLKSTDSANEVPPVLDENSCGPAGIVEAGEDLRLSGSLNENVGRCCCCGCDEGVLAA